MQVLQNWKQESSSAEAVTLATTFTFPFAWLDRQFFARFEGVSSSFEVAINGKRVGYSQDGSSAVEFDLTEHCTEGVNNIAVTIFPQSVANKLSNTQTANIGFTGNTYIVSQPKVRIRDIDIKTSSVHSNAVLEAAVVMKSHLLNSKDYRLMYELRSPLGAVVSQGERNLEVEMRREDTVRFLVTLPQVEKWSAKQPNLYTLVIRTQNSGRFGEYVATRVGFRDLMVTDEGEVYINGNRENLNVARIEANISGQTLEQKLKELNKQNYNTVRATTPMTDEFYVLFDRIGLSVFVYSGIHTSHDATLI